MYICIYVYMFIQRVVIYMCHGLMVKAAPNSLSWQVDDPHGEIIQMNSQQLLAEKKNECYASSQTVHKVYIHYDVVPQFVS